ncbi:MAG TPA: ABC transporter permease subunit, partial [Gemmataceae bacterium]|nr:ABC transporter permease subunit [Gemmataceae bacterium]
MFASLVIEQEPLQWHSFPAAFEMWLRVMGAFSAVALVLYFVIRLFSGRVRRGPRVPWLGFLLGSSTARARYDAVQVSGGIKWPAGQAILFRWLVLGMIGAYALCAALWAPVALSTIIGAIEGDTRPSQPLGSEALRSLTLDVAAACALLAVALPFLADLLRLRWSWRRIWALSRLSFKEAVRRRVPWVFSAFLLIILFASWFMPYKYEDQVRNYVAVVYLASAILFLFAASLLAAFSLPADMRNQTIHTIVTKPVERFEIVLGRFIGYSLLMTVFLAVITSIGLLYVFREIDPDARYESMRARVPVFGELLFRGKEGENKVGVNVGREWDYRSYIMGGPSSSHRAVWNFKDLPAELANRPIGAMVPCEFSLDIFRTVKGEEGKPVFCSFVFVTRNYDPRQLNDYRKAREQAEKIVQSGDRRTVVEQATREIRGDSPSVAEVEAFTDDRSANAIPRLLDRLLAEKFGMYEVTNKGIVDYHTQGVELPASLFKNAFQEPPAQASLLGARQTEESAPLLSVAVKCESAGQYVGAAKRDLYLLAAEGS